MSERGIASIRTSPGKAAGVHFLVNKDRNAYSLSECETTAHDKPKAGISNNGDR